VINNFWRKIDLTSEDKCWEWKAYINKQGYGWMNVGNKRSKPSHRVSALIHNLIQSIDDVLQVLHKCDNRKCCNPHHLFVGTHTDNMKDKAAKGRAKGKPHPGENNPMAKLKQSDVNLIRGLYFSAQFSQSKLAKNFGVQQSHISRIVTNVRWGGAN
jgi:predicted XRE-type DNA-binding protein